MRSCGRARAVEWDDLSGSQKQVSDLFDRFAESEPFAGPVVEFGGDPVEVLSAVDGEVGALRKVLAEQAVGRSYVCQAAWGEAVEPGGCAGGGLDAAVEPSGEGALEATADVSTRLALGDAFVFVGPGFVVAAQSGNRDRVQGAVEVPVAGTAESVSGPLAAAGLEGSDTSQ